MLIRAAILEGTLEGCDQVPEHVQRALDGDIDVAPFVSHPGIRSVITFAE